MGWLWLGWLGQAEAQHGWASHLVGPRAADGLSHPEMEDRLAAVRILGVRGEPRRAVAELLEHLDAEEDPRVRRAVFDSLRRRGDPSAVGPLAAHLADWGRDDRAAALGAIGALGGEEAIRVLIEWLGAADVGDDAVTALATIGAPTVPHLVRALTVPVAASRAARALGRVGDARATPALVVALPDALPVARIAIIDALAQIGDPRASSQLVDMLDDPNPEVAMATLRALRRIGGLDQVGRIAELADGGETRPRAEALRALITIDPERAAPRIRVLLEDPEAPPLLRQVALDGIVGSPEEPFVPSLAQLLADPDSGERAAEALSRIPEGRGLAVLLERSRAAGGNPFGASIALAVRRWVGVLPSGVVREARSHLRADRSDAGLVISALALDRQVATELADRIGSEDPEARANAARGLWLLGEVPPAAVRAISERLPDESDPGVFRVLAAAAIRVGAPVDPARIDARWWDPSTAPEALWLTARNLSGAAPRTRRRARRAMRRSLRAPEARVRAGAAVALALASERTAWRALVATLEDEHDGVRLAGAHALGVLGVPEAGPAIAARRRVEGDARVRSMLSTAESACAGARRGRAFAAGGDVLYARVITAAGLHRADGSLTVDVVLQDGRWMRVSALPDGAVIVPDLPAGSAEVQVRLGP